ncbi:MAG: transcriptional repressor [Treponema sp.]|jgi:Fur family peroxide stress response transcriptional regulator|nr:transcriptional repressor [Treponema sp.]
MGKKNSKKRDAILQTIRSADSHPGARWVYQQLKPVIPDLSLGTVYRNIALFLEEGIIASLGVIGGEERFDAQARPHAHVICTRCGYILDIAGKEIAGLEPPVFEALGFTIDIRRTVFYGVCKACGGLDRQGVPAGSPAGV